MLRRAPVVQGLARKPYLDLRSGFGLSLSGRPQRNNIVQLGACPVWRTMGTSHKMPQQPKPEGPDPAPEMTPPNNERLPLHTRFRNFPPPILLLVLFLGLCFFFFASPPSVDSIATGHSTATVTTTVFVPQNTSSPEPPKSAAMSSSEQT